MTDGSKKPISNRVKCSDIIFNKTYMKIFIEKSKTGNYRDGAWVVITKTKRIICPVKLLRHHVNRLNFPPSSEEYIFKTLFYSKDKTEKKYKCKKSSKPFSYSRTRETILDAFEKIRLPKRGLFCIAREQEDQLLQQMQVDFLSVTDVGSLTELRMAML